MNTRRHQEGIAAGLIALLAILVIVGFAAVQVLARFGAGNRANGQSTAHLAALAEAIEQYAAGKGRLPCPANPTLDSGDEAVPTVNDGTCLFPEGTVPWKTVGAKRDDAVDSWGWKISYRVFTGTAGTRGSLTQDNGINMVECDTVDPGAGLTTPVSGVQGGLCVTNTNPTLRSTTPANFLAGKGLTVNDSGSPHADVAFVLVSHGSTGRGAYTAAGTRTDLPAGHELANTAATGPFWIEGFSGTDPSDAAHFDDLLFYRTLPDLVRKTNLAARDWPEPAGPPTATTAVTFNNATVAAATGTSSPGSLGRTSANFTGATVSGFTGTSTAINLAYDGAGGMGAYDINGNALNSYGNKWLRIDLTNRGRRFALTLTDFGTNDIFGSIYKERVELKFFDTGVQVGSAIVKSGCNIDGGPASFSLVDPGAAFNRVEVTPIDSIDPLGNRDISTFLVAEFKACAESDTTCATSLATAPNTCP